MQTGTNIIMSIYAKSVLTITSK